MKKSRLRLDALLVERGLFETRTKAAAAVMAGQVLVEGVPAVKAGAPTNAEAAIEILKPCPYVSRGGLKLEAALSYFPVSIEGRTCLDLGASTGGFTDCLLQRGAAKVYAVDVGTAQLHDRLRKDPRVASRENTHAKRLEPEWFAPRPDLAVVDVSFISLTQVLPWVVPCLKEPFDILALIKPQFEVGPKLAPKGVVHEEKVRALAVEKIRNCLAGLGLSEAGLYECPVHGPKGNVESFIFLRPSGGARL
ncbi:MAG: TlyA family RNA methyltransferase [Elusimicrobia bacterium]|nr:TlyA family RNA methyltransferase [Elusimicrobiota bacterium]